jgi:hypothetical protein
MNKKIANKWAKALRSRKYKKGQGALCQKDANGNKKHCCLGVLCELYQKDKVNGGDLHIGDYGYLTYNDEDAQLPFEVKKWAGMSTYDGRIDHGDGISLSQLNDSKKINRPFHKIADIIDRYWDRL